MDQRALKQFGNNALGQFKKEWTVEQLERRFAAEEAQLSFFILHEGTVPRLRGKKAHDR